MDHAKLEVTNLPFKTFPEFSKLTLNDRKVFERVVAEYPPISDLSFGTLMSWFGMLERPSISQLHNNLVISYWLPGVEKRSGLAVIGTENLDETMCTIFDYQREKGDKMELVNVPEFVLEHLEHPELFNFKGIRSMDEYIIPVSRFYPLNRMLSYRRKRVNTFTKNIGAENIAVKLVDLSDRHIQEIMTDNTRVWTKKGTVNDVTKMENAALHRAIIDGDAMGFDCVGVFVRGELEAYCIYQMPKDKNYAFLDYFKVNGKIPKILDYAVYALGKWFADHETVYANIGCDLGLPSLRAFKLTLGPTNYFRKYRITPSKLMSID
jgi:hypothetical protein